MITIEMLKEMELYANTVNTELVWERYEAMVEQYHKQTAK